MEQLSFADFQGMGDYKEARAWRAENSEAWDLLVEWAHVDHRAGRTCAMQLYLELLRRPELRPSGFHRVSGTYLANHNLRSALSRLMVIEHPYLVFEFRRSRCDAPGAPMARPVVPRA
jgi:hypothetical protein